MDSGRILRRSPVVCAALLAAAAVGSAQEDGSAPEADAPRETETCLDRPTIRRTRVLNDRNIVFITRDDTIYNNQLPRECPTLRRGSRLSYAIENRRVCAGGSFQVLWQTGADQYIPAFVCQLGYFLPITEGELEDLTAATEERRPRRRSRREAVSSEQVELPRPATAPPAGVPANAD